MFGCCSSYIECSDEGRCLHLDNETYQGCMYRKNLEAGKVFFGQNKGKVKSRFSQEVLERYKEYNIFLICYNKPYAIKSYQKKFPGAVSYPLTKAQMILLESLFEVNGIPYDNCHSNYDLKPADYQREVCDSRVIFEAADERFSMMSYDVKLIQKSLADKIAAALKKKGIKAQVECYYHKPYVPPAARVMTIAKGIVTERKVVYEQATIFSLIGGIGA